MFISPLFFAAVLSFISMKPEAPRQSPSTHFLPLTISSESLFFSTKISRLVPPYKSVRDLRASTKPLRFVPCRTEYTITICTTYTGSHRAHKSQAEDDLDGQEVHECLDECREAPGVRTLALINYISDKRAFGTHGHGCIFSFSTVLTAPRVSKRSSSHQA